MSMAAKYKAKKAARRASKEDRDKGVHGTLAYQEIHKDERKGKSEAGQSVRHAGREGVSALNKKRHLERAKDEHREKLSELKEMRGQDKKYLAQGGAVEHDAMEGVRNQPDILGSFDIEGQDGNEGVAEYKKFASGGMACKACGYAEGGFVEDELASGYEHDLVSSVMAARSGPANDPIEKNDTEGVSPDSEPSQYDAVVKADPDLDAADYDAENSGDEEGNEQKEDDEKDVVSSVMKSRKKKDKNPDPA